MIRPGVLDDAADAGNAATRAVAGEGGGGWDVGVSGGGAGGVAAVAFGGDRWWFATVILFGPRWLCAVPLVVLLVPAAWLIRRRSLWVLGVTAIVVVGPVMGFCIPWARLAAADGPSFRVLTCNVKGRCVDNAALDRLIADAMPDIVALQGCWSQVRVRWPAGWHVCQVADFVVASRFPVIHEETDHSWRLPGHWPRMDMVRFIIQADGRDIDFCSVHLLSPHQGLEAVLDRQTVLRPSDSPALDAEIETAGRSRRTLGAG